MKHKVSELEGALLDAAVAKAEGDAAHMAYLLREGHGGLGRPYSSEWHCGGPIIERETISVGANFAHGERDAWRRKANGDHWWASIEIPVRGYTHAGGPTPLIAAMRAYVASKLGDEVELP